MSKRYQSDLTDKQWAILRPLIPAEKEGGRPRTTDMREVMNAIFYLLRTGYQWDYIIDSQTVKTAGPAISVGYDGGKKIKGRKRHIRPLSKLAN